MELRIATATLVLALASTAVGCAGKLPTLQLAPVAQGPLSVFVEPDATVTTVVDEKGRDIIPLLREALDAGLTDAGYHVVLEPTAKADLTIHMSLAKVGYTKYGTAPRIWAGGVVLDVSGAGKPLTHVKRSTVNWSDYEGGNISERLHFTARVLVNRISRAETIAAYAADHPVATSATVAVTMGVATPVAVTAAPASTPAPATTPDPAATPAPAPPAP